MAIIYIKNNTSTDLVYYKNGYTFTLYANSISKVDDTLVLFSELFNTYQTNIQLISNPTETEIAQSVLSLPADNVNVSAGAIALLNELIRGGDRTKKQLEYLLDVQRISDAVGSITGYSATTLTEGEITNPTLYRGFKVIVGGTLVGTYADGSTFDFETLEKDLKELYLEQIVSFTGTATIKMVK